MFLLGATNSMNIKLMSQFTLLLLLRNKLVLMFPLSYFPNTILSENEFINLPHWTTRVNHSNLTFRKTLKIFFTIFTFHASIFYLHRSIGGNAGGSIDSDGGGGRREEDFRVCLFPGTFP